VTDCSVADAGFWKLFRDSAPYTFDLLDRIGFDAMCLPRLRYVTQAGGRLAPDRVRRYAELGRRAGWELFVMYGQTEATARMAYLPPGLATTHPHCIGVPIPGGSFRLAPVPGLPNARELVYTGANVMLGYAETPADLGLGRTVNELHTGDIARRTTNYPAIETLTRTTAARLNEECTFVRLGGESLSYVEMTVRLEQATSSATTIR
jgi:acyl-CoA synthetase (AMP-forming)/AMP-acid ligase II